MHSISPGSPEEQTLREMICQVGRLMRQYNYIDSTNGNISVRLGDGCLLITPSGIAKGFMRPEQLVVVNMQGEKIGPHTQANINLKPSSELLMHLECYSRRPDIGAVIHAHPPYAIALTISGISLQQSIIPEALIFFGDIPTTVYATPASPENRDAIRELITSNDAIMLAYHGSITVAPDLWKAYLQLEALEQVAKITFFTQLLGGVKPLTSEQIDKLMDLRRSLGFPGAYT